MSNVTSTVEAYAAYLNQSFSGLGWMDVEQREQFDEDLVKARRAMEIAWLEDNPVVGERIK